MNAKMDRSMTNLMLVALVLAVVTISCSRVREIVSPSQSDTVRKFNSELPSGVEHAERVYLKESSFVIVLPDSGEILLQDAESRPVDLATLGERLSEYTANKHKYDAPVYIKASSNRDPRTFIDVLNEIRRRDVQVVHLLVSGRPNQAKGRGLAIPEPDSAFEVKIRDDVYEFPNPLTLIVSRKSGSPERIEINNEAVRDHDEMGARLTEIFRQRENNGVFREGTNEVEKTVWLKLDDQVGNYGDVIKLIDALKGAGASPIVLIDEGKQWEIAKKGSRSSGPNGVSEPHVVKVENPFAKKPKTISGGVLNGKAISLPKPPYPAAARAVGASGMVSVQVTVDPNGNVVSAMATSGHPLLRPAAVAAARSAKFAPTLLGGERVSVTGFLTYNFSPDPVIR